MQLWISILLMRLKMEWKYTEESKYVDKKYANTITSSRNFIWSPGPRTVFYLQMERVFMQDSNIIFNKMEAGGNSSCFFLKQERGEKSEKTLKPGALFSDPVFSVGC